MNDDFFSKFHKSPRPEFAQSLYAILAQDIEARSFINRRSALKRITFALATIFLLFVFTLAVSPTARVSALAVVKDIIEEFSIRGVTVFVTDESLPTPTAPAEGNESYSAVWTPLSPQDISADYPFFAKLPTWIPNGYVLQERAALYYFSIIETPPFSALFEWKDNTGETIQLEVMQGSCLNGQFYDSDGPFHDRRSDCTIGIFISVESDNKPEVLVINGQPAVFFRGVMKLADLSGAFQKWNPSREKVPNDFTKGTTMIWENEGRTFWLSVESVTITKEDVIRLAESIP